MGFENTRDIESNSEMELKIAEYWDIRVSPSGIVSLDERISESRNRYRNASNFTVFETTVAIQKRLELWLFEQTDAVPDDVTEQSCAPYLRELRDYEISTST